MVLGLLSEMVPDKVSEKRCFKAALTGKCAVQASMPYQRHQPAAPTGQAELFMWFIAARLPGSCLQRAARFSQCCALTPPPPFCNCSKHVEGRCSAVRIVPYQGRLKDSNFRLRKSDSNLCRAVLNVLTIAGFVIFVTVRGPHLHSDAP